MTMTIEKTGRTRLDTSQKMQALALIARGDTAAQVSSYFVEKFGFPLNPNTVAQYRKTHAATIAVMRQQHQESEAADAQALLHRTRRLIGRKLSRAENDASTLAELDAKLRKGDIEYEEYERQRVGLLDLSVQELTSVSREMHAESRSAPPDPAANGALGNTAAGTNAVAALVDAIKSGNHVEIQRLILHSNDKSE